MSDNHQRANLIFDRDIFDIKYRMFKKLRFSNLKITKREIFSCFSLIEIKLNLFTFVFVIIMNIDINDIFISIKYA